MWRCLCAAQPVDFPVVLSANYGELRTNHFHSGVDIKTQGSTGKNVRSIADGYVARVSVSPSGFGRAIYINHPDGTTTVYGHLDSFSSAVADYVKEQQYAKSSFRVDLYPAKDKLPVKKGEVIALSGNSGSSGGPHLHFEIRSTASQVPLNPLTKGTVSTADTIAPKPITIYWTTVDYQGAVPVHSILHKVDAVKTGRNEYTLTEPLIKVGQEGYMAVEVNESKNGTDNFMGPASITADKDGERFFSMSLDAIPFDIARYSNAVTFPAAATTRNGVYRLCVLPNNPLKIYRNVMNRGMINLQDTAAHKIEVTFTDDCGNSSLLSFNIRRDDSAVTPAPRATGQSILWAHGLNYEDDGIAVTVPPGALYESTIFNVKTVPALSYGYSRLYAVHDPHELLQKSITISIKADGLPPHLREKALIGQISPTGRRSSAGGRWKSDQASGSVETTAGAFGRFYIAVDTVAPRITPSFTTDADLSAKKSMTVTISDDFSGIGSYNATIDGKWALFEYDPKTSRLIHYFDDARFGKGTTHTLTVEVTDAKGNKTVFNGKYKR